MSNDAHTLLHGDLTKKVIGCFYDTYNELGFGFPEFVCLRALAITVADAGLTAVEEATLPVFFRGNLIVNFRVDLVVNGVLLIEVKATREIQSWHVAQLRNYLKATELSVGLVVNFGPTPSFQRCVFDTARTAHRDTPFTPPDLSALESSERRHIGEKS